MLLGEVTVAAEFKLKGLATSQLPIHLAFEQSQFVEGVPVLPVATQLFVYLQDTHAAGPCGCLACAKRSIKSAATRGSAYKSSLLP